MAMLALKGGTPVFTPAHTWPRWPQPRAIDRKRVMRVIDSGEYGLGSPVIDELACRFAGYTDVPFALPVNSGTAALELAVKAVGLGPGDEVIVPAYTFVATATCVLEMGATVVFADVDPATVCMDLQSVARLVTNRTRAIIPVHFGGNPADVLGLKRLVRGRDSAIIEDAAHAHGMLYRGKAAGSRTSA